jgi:glutamate formiminotransferase/formiminotetrahydrofolate cyclodeaminase
MGIWGAYKNVVINMAGITDDIYKKQTLEKADALKNRAADMCGQVLEILDSRS